MAELLVRAKKHWQDDWDQKKVDSLTEEEKASYDARSQIGDVIVVRPDGWKWGKCECLPEYLVVKVPDKIDDAKRYEEPLVEEVTSTIDGKEVKGQRMLRTRKYSIPKTEVDKKSLEVKDLEEITPVELSIGRSVSAKVVVK